MNTVDLKESFAEAEAEGQPSRPSIVLHPDDNVGICLLDADAGETREATKLVTDIPAGHKFALTEIKTGSPVMKFGYPIGYATSDISTGDFIHTHNCKTGLKENLEYSYDELVGDQPVQTGAKTEAPTFQGYRRADGRAAIRNEVWIINTVGCVNGVAQRIAAEMNAELAGPGGPVDGVFTYVHPFGCSQLGDDLANTQAALAGLINHPNAGGVLILGLGCENNQLKLQLEKAGPIDPQRVRFFYTQQVEDEVAHGKKMIRELAEYAGKTKREPIPASELVIAMKCGGSDGYSGITANPLLGRLADQHAAWGGTSLLSEVPEMFGAEQVLLAHSDSRNTFDSLVHMVNRFKDYFRFHNQPVSENPSPGNKAGGITTLEEKSLGCIQKGGQAPVKEICEYGQPATQGLGGLSLVNAPGNDGTSCTAMTAAGAHMILFTTGRGTPFGVPAPTMKIATNSSLAERKPGWIDFNAGRLVESDASIDDLADELLDLVLRSASGEPVRNEVNGYREIAIWKTGVTV